MRRGEEFTPITSVVTRTEIDECYEPKRTRMIDWLNELDCEVLMETQEAVSLAEEYVRFGVLSRKHYNDLLHISFAVVSECHFIVSWNFNHFVNVNKIDRVNAVNLINGYPTIGIVAPPMLERGEPDE